ncbi:VOC family protein [Novosphingobium terrae]|uniref:VOC family protein n=1 Tax=Novosphingobium terrae TaxID=2726189 RepID=UPI0019821455|nr:VOC family protein [Novosphingobium terrae]
MTLPPSAHPIGFVFSTNPQALKSFYADVLGLPLTGEDDFAIAFDLGQGAMLRLTNLPSHKPEPHTAFGWSVADIRATILALKAKGVAFKTYDGFGQDSDGVWTAPDGQTMVAWFPDPEGNLLSLTQF